MSLNIKIQFPFFNYTHSSRIYLLVPIILILTLSSLYKDYLFEKIALFFLIMTILELLRTSNKCFLDPIYFHRLKLPWIKKYTLLFATEYLGPSIVVLVLFIIGSTKNTLPFLLILISTYNLFTAFKLTFIFIGSRMSLISMVYQWLLFLLLGISGSLSGLFISENNHTFNELINNWLILNQNSIILVSTILLLIIFTVGITVLKGIYKKHPFINSNSFPKRMI